MGLRWSYLVLIVSVTLISGARFFADTDLHERDQPKTVGYTADMVINHRWILPRDPLGLAATKPPMYNWIGAVAVLAVGRFDDWVLRIPSLLAGFLMLPMVIWMATHLARGGQVEPATSASPPDRARDIAVVAGMCWVANYAVGVLYFEARPNMVLVAFMTGAWILATVAMESATGSGGTGRPKRFAVALGLWLCVAGAALSKGPAALLSVLYVPLAARLIYRSRLALWRTGIVWGLPLAVSLVGLWIYLAWRVEPDHVIKRLLGREMFGRVINRDGPSTIPRHLLAFWQPTVYYIRDLLPWSIFMLLALYDIGPRRWFRHRLAPAILWLLLAVVFFSLLGNKKATYMAPAYAAGAIITAYWLLTIERVMRLSAWKISVLGLIPVAVVATMLLFWPRFTREGYGNNVRDFAYKARRIVGDDPVIFLETGYNPLMMLMGRHQGQPMPNLEQTANARWIVRPYDPDADTGLTGMDLEQQLILGAQDGAVLQPLLLSGPITGMGKPRPVALFAIDDNPPRLP